MDIRTVQNWRKTSGWVAGTNTVQSGAFSADPQPGDTVIVGMYYFRGAGGSPGDLTNAPVDTDGNTFTQVGSTEFPQTFTGVSVWKATIGSGGGGSTYRITVSADNLDAISALGAHAWIIDQALSVTSPGGATQADATHPFNVISSGGVNGLHLAFLLQQFANIYAYDASGGWNATGVNGFTSGMLAETDDGGTFFSMVSQYQIGQGPISIDWDYPGSPSATNWAVISISAAPPINTGSFVAGSAGTVASTLTALFNLDGVTRTVQASGSLAVGGNVALIEQATPPTAVSGMVLLFAEDNGSGKLRLMARFPTGSDVQLGIEP